MFPQIVLCTGVITRYSVCPFQGENTAADRLANDALDSSESDSRRRESDIAFAAHGRQCRMSQCVSLQHFNQCQLVLRRVSGFSNCLEHEAGTPFGLTSAGVWTCFIEHRLSDEVVITLPPVLS